MRAHSSVPILDVRDDLRRAKQVERVYDVTDSHWNSSGGYIAYARIMQALSAWFPEARAMPRSEFRDVVEIGPGGDLARMLGIADRIPEERLKLVPRTGWHFHHTDEAFPIAARLRHPELTIATEWTDAKLPRAVLFRDSFAAQLIPFLAEHFQRILCVWDRDFDRAIIEHERPGVVIQEIVERAGISRCPTVASRPWSAEACMMARLEPLRRTVRIGLRQPPAESFDANVYAGLSWSWISRAAFAGSGMTTPKWMSSLFCSAGERVRSSVGHGPFLAAGLAGELEVLVDSLVFASRAPIASFTDPDVGFGVIFVEDALLFEPLIGIWLDSGERHEVEVDVGRGLRWPPSSGVAGRRRECVRPPPERPSTRAASASM